jgi:alpha-glucosidase
VCPSFSHTITVATKYRRHLEQLGEEECICLEGDIGGGLVLQRQISILKDNPKIVQIDSSIQARSVGPCSGGFSR